LADASKLRERDVNALLSALDDYRGVVAAGKVQRWDVLKWAVAVNLGFATASVVWDQKAPWLFFALTLAVVTAGIGLIFYYTLRMTRTRELMAKLADKLAEDCLDVRKVEKEQRDPKSFCYDKEELILFPTVIVLSAIPIIILFLRA